MKHSLTFHCIICTSSRRLVRYNVYIAPENRELHWYAARGLQHRRLRCVLVGRLLRWLMKVGREEAQGLWDQGEVMVSDAVSSFLGRRACQEDDEWHWTSRRWNSLMPCLPILI